MRRLKESLGQLFLGKVGFLALRGTHPRAAGGTQRHDLELSRNVRAAERGTTPRSARSATSLVWHCGPDPGDGVGTGAAGHNPLAIAAKGDSPNHRRMSLESEDFVTGRGVPDFCGSIFTARDDAFSIGTDR